MTDIIERLRRYKGPWLVPAEAADEIEKLRAERDAAVKALQVPVVTNSLTAQSRLDAAAFREERDEARALLNGVLQDIAQLESERDAAVKALERIKNHVDTDEYAYEIAVAAIDAARGEK